MSKMDNDAREITYRLVKIYMRDKKTATPEELARVAGRIYKELRREIDAELRQPQVPTEFVQSGSQQVWLDYYKAHPLAKGQQAIDQGEENRSPAPTAPKGEGSRKKHSRLMRQAPEIERVVRLKGPHAAMDEFGIASYVTLTKILQAEAKRRGESAKARPGLPENEVVVQRWVDQPETSEPPAVADRFDSKMPPNENQIKELRHRLGLSQKDLAQILEVSYQSVYRWEKGKSKPLPTYQKKLWQLWETSDERKALKGEVNSNSKVPTELAEIRRLRESGLTYDSIGKITGVSRERVRQLVVRSHVRKQVKMKAEAIKRLRSFLNMTQERMAAELGVSVTTVRRWESGVIKPSPLAQSRLRELARKG